MLSNKINFKCCHSKLASPANIVFFENVAFLKLALSENIASQKSLFKISFKILLLASKTS